MMKKRGRPSEQLRRQTTRGRVWAIISTLRSHGDFGRSIREVAHLSRCSIGAVAKTIAWRGYLSEKRTLARSAIVSPKARLRCCRRAESVEGRVIQIVQEASSRDDFSLSARRIAGMIGCSTSAVGKTEAWKGYILAREVDKDAAKIRRSSHRIK